MIGTVCTPCLCSFGVGCAYHVLCSGKPQKELVHDLSVDQQSNIFGLLSQYVALQSSQTAPLNDEENQLAILVADSFTFLTNFVVQVEANQETDSDDQVQKIPR